MEQIHHVFAKKSWGNLLGSLQVIIIHRLGTCVKL